MVTFIIAGLIAGVNPKEMPSSILFITIAVNAAMWIVIMAVIIPKLGLPENIHLKTKECIKHYFIGLGLMYLTMIFMGILLQLSNYQPQTQEVASQIIIMGKENIFLALIGPAILIPVIEEFLFRSVLYRSIKVSLSPLIAALISAGVFGLVHGEFDVIPQLIALGLVFTYIYEKSGSIMVASALHATNNSVAIIFMIYGPEIVEWLQATEKQLQSAGFGLLISG